MAKLLTIILTALLLLPLSTAPAEAKVKSAATQVHVVKQGDNLYDIAQKHGMTVKQLKHLNGLSSNRLRIGQKLALDRTAAPPLPQNANNERRQDRTVARQPAAKSVHVVKKGDSLHTIAKRHGITVDQLTQYNNLNSNNLKIGQRLVLTERPAGTGPEAVATAPAADTWSGQQAVEQHIVKKGDTPAKIAKRYHLSLKELKRLNGLRSDTRLQIGQRLVLSDPYENRAPLLLPGDSSDDEVLEMAYSAKSELEQAAFNFLGTRYRFGGNSRKGIDCSAFVQQVFREVDVNLPRSAREQFRVGAQVERDEMQKGDLIFFRTYARFPSHVGIYLGDGKMIHASSRSRRVVVTSIDHPYYKKRFIGAKRITLLEESSQLDVAGLVDEEGVAEETDLAAPVDDSNRQTIEATVPATSETAATFIVEPTQRTETAPLAIAPKPVN